jgi:hypothetical protein
MAENPTTPAAELRTPRAAAVAGIVFALAFGLAVLLLRSVLPEGARHSDWLGSAAHRRTLKLALEVIPFAGIAFLWFIGVIRSRLGEAEDKLFATVFLGSGLLFVAMLFTSAAIIGGMLSLYSGGQQVAGTNVVLATEIARFLIGTLGTRMAAVFTLVVTNLGRRTGVVPRWLVVFGFVCALLLFVVPPHVVWIALVFPLWVLVLSVQILLTSFRTDDKWAVETPASAE